MAGASTSNKRRQGSPDDSSGGVPPWIVCYTCLMILMLAFFIILVSYGTMEQGKIVQFVGSFVGSFNILPGGVKSEPGGEIVFPSKDIIEYTEAGSFVSKLKKSADEQGFFRQKLDLSVATQGVLITFYDYLLFGLDPGKADINPKMKPFLDDLAELIRDTSYLVRIEGHTDNMPIQTKEFPSNWELSTARTVNILKYLMDEGGIAASRLSAVGCGEYQPLFPNDTPEHRAGNRRIMIYLEKNELETNRYNYKNKMISKEGIMKSF